MPSGRFRHLTRRQLAGLARWALLALASVPLMLAPRLVLGDREASFFLPGELGNALGIVEALPGQPAPPVGATSSHPETAAPAPHASQAHASTASRRLVPVVTASCGSCRVVRDASTGAIRVTLGPAARTNAGSAFALLDFGGLGGAAGLVRVHDRIGLDRGQ